MPKRNEPPDDLWLIIRELETKLRRLSSVAITPPLSVPIFAGAGKINVTDDDFDAEPPNGTVAVALNTSNGNVYWNVRVQDGWFRVIMA